MGKKSELSPIDPTLHRVSGAEAAGPLQEISVEDVNSYVSFIRERANINDQSSLAQMISILANTLSPLTLGSINRQNSHIRLVARKLITCRNDKLDETQVTSIVDTLTEKIYSHGHAIGRKEAKEIGLPIEDPTQELETLLWNLYIEYEDYLKINEPLDPIVALGTKEEYHEDKVPIAVIQSENLTHEFEVMLDIRRRRNVPANPQININLSFNLPPQVKPEQIPAQMQQVLQQLLSQLGSEVQKLVQQELIRQSPEAGLDIRVYGGRWIPK